MSAMTKSESSTKNQSPNLFFPGQLVRHTENSKHVFVVVAEVTADDDSLVWCVSPYELILRKYERKFLKASDVDPAWLLSDARTRELPEAPTGWMTAEDVTRMLLGD